MRRTFLCAIVALVGCGGSSADPDAGTIVDPPLLDAGRPNVVRPPPSPPRGCAWEEPEPPRDVLAGSWDRRFMLPGLGGALPAATAIAPMADGSIVIGGNVSSVGTVAVSNVARWHPERGWEPLGSGLPNEVTALATDGTALFAATRELEGGAVHRFTGTAWETLGSFDAVLQALELGPDGALYAGGSFSTIGTVSATRVAKYQAGVWSAVHADGPDGEVSAISIDARELCVGGNFSTVGALDAVSVACLIGGRWEARSLPEYGFVKALVRDPANGTLIAGGHFPIDSNDSDLGGSIARWNGGRWELIGGGLHNFGLLGPAYVEGVEIIDGVIHAAGAFGFGGTGANLVPLDSVAALRNGRWDDLEGGLRKRLGVSLGNANVLATAVDTRGRLIAGGLFSLAGTQSVIGVAAWDGAYWRALGGADRPPVGGINGNVETMAARGRCALFVGGTFEYAGDVRANNVARFDERTGWHALGDGLPFSVVTLAVTDRLPAIGPDLEPGATVPIGGEFGGLYAATATETGSALVLWDGNDWREVGAFDGMIFAIAVADDGTIVVGGEFTRVGDDQPASRIARFDGVRWSPLETGVDGGVRALRYLPDGKLLVGGNFGSAGGIPASAVAVWDGSAWSALGAGFDGSFGVGSVEAFAVIDGTLYAAGDFVSSDGRPMENVAQWNTVQWLPVGGGLPGLFVQDMRAVGNHLVAVGFFSIDGEDQTLAALIDGRWTPFPGDTDDLITSIEARPEGLYLGGPFINANDAPSVGIALFRYAGGGQ